MKPQRMPTRWLLGPLALWVGLAAGCAAQGTSGPRAWIDVPIDGSILPAGQEIEVQSHAFASEGVAEVLLVVNGVPYRRDPPSEPGADFTGISQAWLPEGPGDYTLQAIAYDSTGAPSSPGEVWVRVAAMTPTPEPTATPEPTPTATPTEIPLAEVTFTADATALVRGACTNLRWEVLNATAVQLDLEAVEASGVRQVCPTVTTEYRLSVEAPGGNLEQQVTIEVSAPPDATAPTISGISASTDEILEPNCEPNTVTISAQVSDTGGVASVEIVYRVTDGSWQTRSMSLSGGSTYSVTLDWLALEASRDPVPTTSGSVLEYSIRARDTAGNTAESGSRTIETVVCFI
jgi:hypothetical protein